MQPRAGGRLHSSASGLTGYGQDNTYVLSRLLIKVSAG
jgi:hypothetical protein